MFKNLENLLILKDYHESLIPETHKWIYKRYISKVYSGEIYSYKFAADHCMVFYPEVAEFIVPALELMHLYHNVLHIIHDIYDPLVCVSTLSELAQSLKSKHS